MMQVINCVAWQHDIWLVGLAAVVCVAGSWATLQLFGRAAATFGAERFGWLILAAVAGGASIWCTHFVAMLGYKPGVPMTFDPLLTSVSLVIAIGGTGVGLAIATTGFSRFAPAIGGAVVGLAISTMHYTGMAAYRVSGIVEWDTGFVIASIVMASVFASGAVDLVQRAEIRYRITAATGLMVAAIVCLHFTAMTAFQVTPLGLPTSLDNTAALQGIAMSVALVALMVIGSGLASHLIDSRTRHRSVQRLTHLAMHDTLTGLPNRANFNEYLDEAISLGKIRHRRVAVVGIDLNRFKEINDQRGHSTGDEALRLLAQRMRGRLADGEFVARIGGDEFGAVKEFQCDEEVLDFLGRLEAALNGRVSLSEIETTIGASIGVAIFPEDGDSGDLLINNADLAMYRAKSQKSTSPCFYDSSMDEAVRSQRALARDLRDAFTAGALEVHYQVQNSIATGAICGYEALLRWKHPTRGYISPEVFVPLAEESGLIVEIGRWVLRRACSDAVRWEGKHKVAVNLSAVQFAQDDLPFTVHRVLLETGLPPSRLELELTETTLMSDSARSTLMLGQIKALGVNIALDDFGTGYSSLGTLRAFPFDKIKLDRSFMQEAAADSQAKAIIRAVLALGKSLHVPVLAEGIETEAQLAILREEGCDEGQGFLFGRPAPLAGHSVDERAEAHKSAA